MVHGSAAEQDRAIGLAPAAGVNHFDTAVQYGNGRSETNLGRVLAAQKPAGVCVGTNVRVPSGSFRDIGGVIARSIDRSPRRLAMDHVDIFHLHNPITANGRERNIERRASIGDTAALQDGLGPLHRRASSHGSCEEFTDLLAEGFLLGARRPRRKAEGVHPSASSAVDYQQ